MKKKFALSAVLSVAGDALMCKIDGVYEILNFMTGDNLFTHQLPRAVVECRPSLMKQHPWLSDYISSFEPRVSPSTYKAVLAECEAKWGMDIEIDELSAAGDHLFKEPLQELHEMVGTSKKIIAVNLGGHDND